MDKTMNKIMMHIFLFFKDAVIIFFFFFSSRRRHTRCYRDWSSDVCSSDLLRLPGGSQAKRHFRVEKIPGDPTHTRIKTLPEDDRRDGLRRMLGGAEFLAVLRERPHG